MESLVEDAKSKGASVSMGGSRHPRGGTFYQPTLLTGVTKDMQCVTEEIFGPMAPIVK